jgi:hypothetical protein
LRSHVGDVSTPDDAAFDPTERNKRKAILRVRP